MKSSLLKMTTKHAVFLAVSSVPSVLVLVLVLALVLALALVQQVLVPVPVPVKGLMKVLGQLAGWTFSTCEIATQQGRSASLFAAQKPEQGQVQGHPDRLRRWPTPKLNRKPSQQRHQYRFQQPERYRHRHHHHHCCLLWLSSNAQMGFGPPKSEGTPANWLPEK